MQKLYFGRLAITLEACYPEIPCVNEVTFASLLASRGGSRNKIGVRRDQMLSSHSDPQDRNMCLFMRTISFVDGWMNGKLFIHDDFIKKTVEKKVFVYLNAVLYY